MTGTTYPVSQVIVTSSSNFPAAMLAWTLVKVIAAQSFSERGGKYC